MSHPLDAHWEIADEWSGLGRGAAVNPSPRWPRRSGCLWVLLALLLLIAATQCLACSLSVARQTPPLKPPPVANR